MVVGHEGVKLQGVELEASVIDGLHILHGVFIHGQQGGGLEGDTNTYVVNQTHSYCFECKQSGHTWSQRYLQVHEMRDFPGCVDWLTVGEASVVRQ